MDWQRVACPQLSDSFVALSNALSKLDQPVALCDAEPGWRILPSMATDNAPVRLSLDVDLAGSLMRAHLGASALETALNGLIPVDAFESLDRELQLAVLNASLEEPFALLGAWVGAEMRLLEIHAPTQAAGGVADNHTGGSTATAPPGGAPQARTRDSCWALAVSGPGNGSKCTILMEFLSPPPESLNAALASPLQRRRDLDHLSFPVCLELGSTALPMADCRNLESGDILLLDEFHAADGGLRINVGNASIWQGQLTGNELTIHDAVF